MIDDPTPLAAARAIITHTQYQTFINAGNHVIIADEPEQAGGKDKGMKPAELLLASLSSCTAITLQMYINRKMWIVEEITVDLKLFAVENATLIKSNIHVKGEISEEQRKRLQQIADVCPIHKMLTGNIVIDTTIR